MSNNPLRDTVISPDIDRIFPKVESALSELLLRNYGEHAQSIKKVQVIERLYSTVVILRVTSDRNEHHLVMKSTTHHPINKVFFEKENQAIVEFNILKYLYPKFVNVEQCSVPEPILVLPDVETYIMRFVEGDLMMDKFRYTRKFSSFDRFGQLKKSMYLYGKWLKCFQDYTQDKSIDGSLAYGQVEERAMHRVELIENNYGDFIPKEFKDVVRKIFNVEQARIKGVDVQLYGRHGDYTPLNAIIGTKGVTVIDFLGFDYEPPEVDVMKVLIFLENESMAFSSSKSRVRDLKAAFIEGYGGLESLSKSGLMICEAMQRIVSIWGHLSTPRRLLHHRIETSRIVKRHTSWFVG